MTVVAKNIFSYVSRKVKRAGAAPFLPMSKKEMETLGWDACDIIIVIRFFCKSLVHRPSVQSDKNISLF